MGQMELKIDGMSCEGCERTVTKALLSVAGVKSAKVSRNSKSALLETAGAVSRESLSASVRKAGYKVL